MPDTRVCTLYVVSHATVPCVRTREHDRSCILRMPHMLPPLQPWTRLSSRSLQGSRCHLPAPANLYMQAENAAPRLHSQRLHSLLPSPPPRPSPARGTEGVLLPQHQGQQSAMGASVAPQHGSLRGRASPPAHGMAQPRGAPCDSSSGAVWPGSGLGAAQGLPEEPTHGSAASSLLQHPRLQVVGSLCAGRSSSSSLGMGPQAAGGEHRSTALDAGAPPAGLAVPAAAVAAGVQQLEHSAAATTAPSNAGIWTQAFADGVPRYEGSGLPGVVRLPDSVMLPLPPKNSVEYQALLDRTHAEAQAHYNDFLKYARAFDTINRDATSSVALGILEGDPVYRENLLIRANVRDPAYGALLDHTFATSYRPALDWKYQPGIPVDKDAIFKDAIRIRLYFMFSKDSPLAGRLAAGSKFVPHEHEGMRGYLQGSSSTATSKAGGSKGALVVPMAPFSHVEPDLGSGQAAVKPVNKVTFFPPNSKAPEEVSWQGCRAASCLLPALLLPPVSSPDNSTQCCRPELVMVFMPHWDM